MVLPSKTLFCVRPLCLCTGCAFPSFLLYKIERPDTRFSAHRILAPLVWWLSSFNWQVFSASALSGKWKWGRVSSSSACSVCISALEASGQPLTKCASWRPGAPICGDTCAATHHGREPSDFFKTPVLATPLLQADVDRRRKGEASQH